MDNPQSNQVALRNGFILEGCLKQAEFLNDAHDDVNLYTRVLSIHNNPASGVRVMRSSPLMTFGPRT